MIASLALIGMILVMSAGLFGAYVLGFYDGVKEGERIEAILCHAACTLKYPSHVRSISNG